jgi:DNA-binding transcriptional MerR regulator
LSTRSYLSIGDVLTLLRQEFPDVTISKIRFLESQGLVNPERTPSGYRKFYEHDVERLRWVLRQQREHFLPLKVIKDRLDEDTDGAEAGAVHAAAKRPAAPVPAGTAGERPVAEPALVGHRTSSGGRADRAGQVPADRTSELPGIEAAAPRDPAATTAAPKDTEPVPKDADTARPAAVGRTPRAATTAHTARPVAASHDGDGVTGEPGSSGNGSGDTVEATDTGVAGDPPDAARRPVGPAAKPAARSVRTASTATAKTAPATSDTTGPAADAPSVSVASGAGGASLTRDELIAASGLSDEYVRQLEEFGLISAITIGGAPFFDEEALTVANVAAKFATFGIEARHLRLYKNAADREAGFIEQIVIPMVRQRNPEARARAVQTSDDLARLGQQLRASLLRRALHQLLNG